MQPGDVLAGKYRVDRVLGEGGMGVVVAATDIYLERRVAIKFLLDDFVRVPEAVERFLREARACARLRSEHVTRLMDYGVCDDGSPILVMEYLAGEDVSSVLEKRGALPVDDVIEYLLQTADALAEAHAQGLVHRDLKPSNLFLTRGADGTPMIKVLDFGISKFFADAPDDSLVAVKITGARARQYFSTHLGKNEAICSLRVMALFVPITARKAVSRGERNIRTLKPNFLQLDTFFIVPDQLFV